MAKLADVGVSIISTPEYTDLIKLKTGEFMDCASRFGDLFKLDVEIVCPNAAHIAQTHPISKASLGLWHHHLGHISKDTIQKMVQADAITGIEMTGNDYGSCSACHKGKQTRSLIPHSTQDHASEVLG